MLKSRSPNVMKRVHRFTARGRMDLQRVWTCPPSKPGYQVSLLKIVDPYFLVAFLSSKPIRLDRNRLLILRSKTLPCSIRVVRLRLEQLAALQIDQSRRRLNQIRERYGDAL